MARHFACTPSSSSTKALLLALVRTQINSTRWTRGLKIDSTEPESEPTLPQRKPHPRLAAHASHSAPTPPPPRPPTAPIFTCPISGDRHHCFRRTSCGTSPGKNAGAVAALDQLPPGPLRSRPGLPPPQVRSAVRPSPQVLLSS